MHHYDDAIRRGVAALDREDFPSSALALAGLSLLRTTRHRHSHTVKQLESRNYRLPPPPRAAEPCRCCRQRRAPRCSRTAASAGARRAPPPAVPAQRREQPNKLLERWRPALRLLRGQPPACRGCLGPRTARAALRHCSLQQDACSLQQEPAAGSPVSSARLSLRRASLRAAGRPRGRQQAGGGAGGSSRAGSGGLCGRRQSEVGE